MREHYLTENEVKKALNIESFRDLTKDKVMAFAAMMPELDRELSGKVIEQFPEYAKSAVKLMEQLLMASGEALAGNQESQANAAEVRSKILDIIARQLENDGLSEEQRCQLIQLLREVHEEACAKDTENKRFLTEIIAHFAQYILPSLILELVVLGFRIKGIKIPRGRI